MSHHNRGSQKPQGSQMARDNRARHWNTRRFNYRGPQMVRKTVLNSMLSLKGMRGVRLRKIDISKYKSNHF